MTKVLTQTDIDRRARYFYLSCMLILGIRFVSNTLFSQLSQPILSDAGSDWTYRIFQEWRIPQMATHSFLWSAVLDILLFLLPLIASLIRRRQIYAFLFSILLLVYQVTFGTYSLQHDNTLAGMMILSIPFWFQSAERFAFAWEGARYYFFFIVVSAAIYSLTCGSLIHNHYFTHILMSQHAQYIYDYPDSSFSQLYTYLISHYELCNGLWFLFVCFKFSFIGGFFSRRYDNLYLIGLVGFVVLDYVFMHLFCFEVLIFALALWDWTKEQAPPLSDTIEMSVPA